MKYMNILLSIQLCALQISAIGNNQEEEIKALKRKISELQKSLTHIDAEFEQCKSFADFALQSNRELENLLLGKKKTLKVCEKRSTAAELTNNKLEKSLHETKKRALLKIQILENSLEKNEKKLKACEIRLSSAEAASKELKISLHDNEEKFKDCETDSNVLENLLQGNTKELKACEARLSSYEEYVYFSSKKTSDEYGDKFETYESRQHSYETATKILEKSLFEKEEQFKACELRSNFTKIELKNVLHARNEICQLPKTCSQVFMKSHKTANGIYRISLHTCHLKPFPVYCVYKGNTAWNVIMRRQDDTENFKRNWTNYVKGFGSLDKSFFIGLKKLHAITNERPHELLITLADYEGNKRAARYDKFEIGGKSQQYHLKLLGKYIGNAGDSLRSNADAPFSTQDNDHSKKKCASELKGGWWYSDCGESNLNGVYGQTDVRGKIRHGITWWGFRNQYYSLKYAEMAIRPIDL